MALTNPVFASSEWSLSLKGVGQYVQGVDDINQCVKILLQLVKGSVPLDLEKGCSALEKIDLPLNKVVQNMTVGIIDTLQLYEPRIKVTAVLHKINGGEVDFLIKYDIVGTTLTGEITHTYGLT